MPIYIQNNSPETPEMFHYSPISAVVHLGSGDVLVSAAKAPLTEGGFANEILFTESEVRPIGEYTEEHRGKPTHAPVVLRFDRIESADALIATLMGMKRDWNNEPS